MVNITTSASEADGVIRPREASTGQSASEADGGAVTWPLCSGRGRGGMVNITTSASEADGVIRPREASTRQPRLPSHVPPKLSIS